VSEQNEGPAFAITNEDGSRWYYHPVKRDPKTEEPVKYLSVTTALNAIGKHGLKFWAAQGAAALAMDEIPRMIKALRREPCDATRSKQACKECRPCVEYWLSLWHYRESEDAKRRGSRIHKYKEHWIRHGQWPFVEEQDRPYTVAFEAFVADYGLEPTSWTMLECTVIDHTFGLAGTLDGEIEVKPVTRLAREFVAKIGKQGKTVRVLEDTKTRAKPGARLYEESALQLAGYRYSPSILLPDGTEKPMPDTDGAAVLQLRPDGYTFRPVDTSEFTYRAFLSAMWLYRWLTECGPQAVQVGSFVLPEDWEPITFHDQPNGRPKKAAKKTTPAKKTTSAPAPAKKTATKKTTTAPDTLLGSRSPSGTLASVTPLRPPDGKPGASLDDDSIPF
jgi:hypothetical protein